MRYLVFALSLALPAFAAHGAETACEPHREASLPFMVDGGGAASVPITIQGKRLRLLVDTGGVDSMLTGATVQALGLATGRLRNVYAEGYGGYRIDTFAEAHDVNLGGLFAPDMRFLVMPDDHVPPGESGTLAPDVLRAYDNDFDFARGRLHLVSAGSCPGAVVYWTTDTPSIVPFQEDRSGHVDVMATLDGAKFRAHLDTGFSVSVMNLEEARNLFRIASDSPDLKPVTMPGIAHAYRYPFKTLSFGGVTIDNPDIILVPEADSHADSAIIGIPVLRQLHLYIARTEHKLYITPATAGLGAAHPSPATEDEGEEGQSPAH